MVTSALSSASTSTTSQAVNSCFRPVCACDGWIITTVEGAQEAELGAKISASLAAQGGSQCGFCSPGMVMHLYAKLSAAGPAGLSAAEIEEGMDGNICRCTGYRPILDAMKSFATAPPPAPPAPLGGGPDAASSGSPAALTSLGGDTPWHAPVTLEAAYALLATPGAAAVCGYSGRCLPYTAKDQPPAVYVDIGRIPELQGITTTPTPSPGIQVGAAVTVEGLIVALQEHAGASPKVFPALVKHLGVVACGQVRNIASIGGNLALAALHGDFPSDLMCILAAVGATVAVGRPGSQAPLVLAVEELRGGHLSGGALIERVHIPCNNTGAELHSFKIRKRRQNAHAVVNLAVLLGVDAQGCVLPGAKLTYGGIQLHVLTVAQTAAALVGQRLGDDTVVQASF
jgi:xanthine dehydrogenase/oxidase